MQLSVAQTQIKTNIRESKLVNNVAAFAVPFGLLPVVLAAGVTSAIDKDVEAHRTEVAESAVKPLRNALFGYDFDARAKQGAINALSEIKWLHTTQFDFIKDSSAEAASARLDSAASGQVVFVDYEYDMTVGFKAIELSFRVSIANVKTRPGFMPSARLHPKHLVYHQWHKVVIQLKGPSNDIHENVRRWAANDGALARQALDSGLEYAQWMIELGLSQTPSDELAIQKNTRVSVHGYIGSLIGKSGTATLIKPLFVDQWVLVAEPVG